MPELPDIVMYIEALEERIGNTPLKRVRIAHPFLLRSVTPTPDAAVGATVSEVRRLGKRIALGFDNGVWFVLHLMIAGRLQWREAGVKLRRRLDLAGFDFESGSVVLTEAGTKRRASLHVVQGDALVEHDPGGLEVLDATRDEFEQALTARNHTLKRALTDPRILSGIGNAYSDEILHRARLSPVTLTQRLEEDAIDRLHAATRDVLVEWVERMRRDRSGGFPEKVTAFRDGMAVHGRYNEPCPVCGAPVQRIRYASNETNYCPTCQTGGKLLADRVLSRLLGKDWPRSLEALEEKRRGR